MLNRAGDSMANSRNLDAGEVDSSGIIATTDRSKADRAESAIGDVASVALSTLGSAAGLHPGITAVIGLVPKIARPLFEAIWGSRIERFEKELFAKTLDEAKLTALLKDSANEDLVYALVERLRRAHSSAASEPLARLLLEYQKKTRDFTFFAIADLFTELTDEGLICLRKWVEVAKSVTERGVKNVFFGEGEEGWQFQANEIGTETLDFEAPPCIAQIVRTISRTGLSNELKQDLNFGFQVSIDRGDIEQLFRLLT
jgi:hypothetical protein